MLTFALGTKTSILNDVTLKDIATRGKMNKKDLYIVETEGAVFLHQFPVEHFLFFKNDEVNNELIII